ncbi:MAG: hypothetical protein COB30_016565 [Ectothiorhodospiraceae bacterium]|nr:hypothetical protein [Ectothiorhodospiraceae bacterium]
MNYHTKTVPPSRHVIAAFTFVVLIPLVYYIPPWVMGNVTDNHFLATVLALAVIVPMVSYVALPVLFSVVGFLRGEGLRAKD